jgi:hypothetical protein
MEHGRAQSLPATQHSGVCSGGLTQSLDCSIGFTALEHLLGEL